eukprot:symbB.v1.2.009138.t1/scaffold577.1/size258142/13
MYSLTARGTLDRPDAAGADESLVGATLQREVRICRPLRHFSECRLGNDRSRPSPRSPREEESSEPWLSFAETATHLPTDVPIWMSPQLRFYAYTVGDEDRDALKRQLWRGEAPERKSITIRRPEQPGVDAVLHPGASSVDAAQRVKLGTAMQGTAMEDEHEDDDWVKA